MFTLKNSKIIGSGAKRDICQAWAANSSVTKNLLSIVITANVFSVNLYAEQKICPDICEVHEYLRTQCAQTCLTDKEQSQKFKRVCEDTGGQWSFTVDDKNVINGFRCESTKITNIDVPDASVLEVSRCQILNQGTENNALQITAVLKKNKSCESNLAKVSSK